MGRLLALVGLLGGLLLVWDALPFYATAENAPETAGTAPQAAAATFAGGCFWCMEKPFDELAGVISTTSGYTGGTAADPSYYQVSAGGTGHVEAVQVRYDPTQVSYAELLQVFWRNVDPLDDTGQFCDKGSQYRSAIFVETPEQQQAAAASRQAVGEEVEGDIATEIRPAATFYPAEEYHQDYYLKHPVRYRFYRQGCGRDRRLEQLWGSSAH